MEITKKDARATIEGVFEVVEDALVEGNKVPLGNIGRLEVRERAARNGVNPQTKEKIVIPAQKALAFKSSKYGKELVN